MSRPALDTPLRVRTADERDRERWDAFVTACPEATFSHKFGWKGVIERGLGHPTRFLLAERDGAIEGVLPLAQVQSWLFGHGLTSLPCCDVAGVAATTDAARDALTKEATALAERLGVDALELRNPQRYNPSWPCKDLYVSFRRPISGNHDENMKAIPRKQRAMVRKGIDRGLVARVTTDPEGLYPLFAERQRDLGTPVFPRRYFRALGQELGADLDVTLVSLDGRDVAGVLSFYFRDEVIAHHGGSSKAARDLKADDFKYWSLMCHAAERGCRVFDYGRSKRDTGSFSFKKNWGFVPQPLYYEYHLVRAKTVPQANPNNPKYRHFIAAWKRLPLPIANAIGPVLSRSLG